MDESDVFETVIVETPKVRSAQGGEESAQNGLSAAGKLRLLLTSSRARNVIFLAPSALPEVITVNYKYESSTLDSILGEVREKLQGHRVESIAMVVTSTEKELSLCGVGEKVLNTHTASTDVSVREFFKSLCERHLEKSRANARLDFLAAHTAHTHDGPVICAALHHLLEIPVSMSVDLQGTNVDVIRWKGGGTSKIHLGELYFDLKRMKNFAKMAGNAAKTRQKDMDNYEMIRTVGKGAFGTAVLYRRKDDDTLVIIKEINMLDLSAAERQLSLNEVNVLAMLDHPNIVRYMDSFELDTKLCIEMEYCDGGSLAQFLTQRSTRLEERDILVIFHQICAAIRHMHEHQILHRDLKTANLFLTKQGIIRVGDFGISKMLSTRQAHANTVLGTPYYISPEMCEGKQYDEKSDIWALGCILYEMACLQKTFEGSNLPALVNKIMRGQFAPIKGNYSPGFKQLVRDLLQRDPEFRPTAAELVTERIPELLSQFSVESVGVEQIDDELRQCIDAVKRSQGNRSSRPLRSVVYHMKIYSSSMQLIPVPLPPRTRVKELAVSTTHVIVLSAEYLVYTWGEGKRGQLGHGVLEAWRGVPAVVEALRGKTMTRVVAGDGFSVFASDNGIIMTCGDGTTGCLGHDDWNSSAKPKLVEKLLSVDVAGLSCGQQHVVVVGSEGDVYSWGKGQSGRLGQGNEEDCCVPREVEVPGDAVMTNVRCGGDGTILISDQGLMYACGNNAHNKLGLSDAGGLFNIKQKNDIKQALVPTRVRSIECRVVDVSMGPYHTAILKETGQIVTFGRNCEGQLGRGNCKPCTQPVLVKSMQEKVVTMMHCGSTFTVVGTLENAIYLWGTRAVLPASRPTTQDGFTMSLGRRPPSDLSARDPEFSFSDSSRRGSLSTPASANSDSSRRTAAENDRDLKLKDVLLQPQEILALYASPAQVAKGETVNLASLNCQNQSVFVVVDTTAPLPKHLRSQSLGGSGKTTAQQPKEEDKPPSLEAVNRRPAPPPDQEMDSMGPVPAWLSAELNEAGIAWSGSKPETKPVNQRPLTSQSLPSYTQRR
ncbi:serine/threonine-protein kinase Nek8-like [Hyalella azteca]|uniref:non-specific serine/threonine protein kinase n=1 Tax=Hyalella azteca TaxID=294128 RepID=A0A8B7N995_HYAAZ|nr:serine/threonine-protein kinase Nek8-like [Hyalella azteca]